MNLEKSLKQICCTSFDDLKISALFQWQYSILKQAQITTPHPLLFRPASCSYNKRKYQISIEDTIESQVSTTTQSKNDTIYFFERLFQKAVSENPTFTPHLQHGSTQTNPTIIPHKMSLTICLSFTFSQSPHLSHILLLIFQHIKI